MRWEKRVPLFEGVVLVDFFVLGSLEAVVEVDFVDFEGVLDGRGFDGDDVGGVVYFF